MRKIPWKALAVIGWGLLSLFSAVVLVDEPWILWAGFVLATLTGALSAAGLIASRTKLRKAEEDLERLARIDDLTGLYNRRQLQVSLKAGVANTDRYDQPLSVLMIDVDRCKEISDNHGHEAVDEVLRIVATKVQDSLRTGDLVGRWGGEEFLVLLPWTDRGQAELVAERVREAVTSTEVVGDQLVPVSVSIGVATHVHGDESDVLIADAASAMH
jgi:diguanylate cyclase (GGDEF)-like protein